MGKIAGVKKLHTTPYHPQGNGQCERFNSTLCNMLGTLSEEEKSDWKSYLGCMTHAYNCTKHASTTYSPYYLMFGRHPRLPIDVEFGLPKSNSGGKSRYVQKLRRRLNYAFQKATKVANQQANKYKSSYDKSINYGSEQFFMCPMFVTECFHNKCFKLSTLCSVYISPGCESDMILSVMTHPYIARRG